MATVKFPIHVSMVGSSASLVVRPVDPRLNIACVVMPRMSVLDSIVLRMVIHILFHVNPVYFFSVD